jgi:Protein of unknown function (DUF3618)
MAEMSEGNSEVAVRDPDELVRQIERTRENLARTIDALTDRVNPASVARRTLFRVREQASRPEAQLVTGAVIITVAGVAYLMWRRGRK